MIKIAHTVCHNLATYLATKYNEHDQRLILEERFPGLPNIYDVKMGSQPKRLESNH